ncbi:MAG: Crp/Fnr family transcriptional regulator [Acidobacteria bacterium]|nr:Crp/Fnr family transcriptional regulator [Acidobacteriota bacterium]
MRVEKDFLKRVTIFSELSESELDLVSQKFREQHYKRGEIVFFEEDTGKYMYIVKEGRVKVSRLLPSGKEMILAFHEPGEYFGEMSLLDGGTTPATVTALMPATILFMTRQEFLDLLDNRKINRALMKMLCTRCRDAWTQIEVLTFNNADARIRTALYNLCQKKGVKTDKGTMISIHLTHKELADMTGISRETATRVLSHLQNENIVRVETRHFLIGDPEQLMNSLLL